MLFEKEISELFSFSRSFHICLDETPSRPLAFGRGVFERLHLLFFKLSPCTLSARTTLRLAEGEWARGYRQQGRNPADPVNPVQSSIRVFPNRRFIFGGHDEETKRAQTTCP
ncbi:MAG: hypothetical protein PVI20_18820 [Desulfobacteraceae bacterium]|jgi:hypothetical protein